MWPFLEKLNFLSFLQALANLNQVSWHGRLPGRRLTLKTIVSLVTSFLMITFHLTNCLMPQNSRKTLKTVWWATVLNGAIMQDLLSTIYYSYAYLEKVEFYSFWSVFIFLICVFTFTLFMYKSEWLNQSRATKFLCFELSLIMLYFFAFHLYFYFYFVLNVSFSNHITSSLALTSAFCCLCFGNLLFACFFVKAALTLTNFSDIWNHGKVFLIDEKFHSYMFMFLLFTYSLTVVVHFWSINY